MKNKLRIMGLGAGTIEQIPLGIYRTLLKEGKCFTRTMDHPVINDLKAEGVQFISFDDVYEKHPAFEQVYEEISGTLLEEAKKRSIIYTVPGHPMVAEKTVQILLERTENTDIEVVVEGGQSFLDALFQAVKIDPIEGFQLLDGNDLKREELKMTQHLIIGQVYDAYIASEVKLTLMEKYPDDYEVAIVTAAGSDYEKVLYLPLYELDRQMELNNLTSVYVPPVKEEEPLYPEFEFLRSVIAKLRGPEGCPWDREQTHESLKKYCIEETYELIEAIDSGDIDSIVSELGDVLLQVLLHAQIGEDDGMFAIEDVFKSLTEKMIRRHPHVFGSSEAANAEEALENWESSKRMESGAERMPSLMDKAGKGLPQLLRAYEIQKQAAKAGFEWNEVGPAWDKVQEEIQEVRVEELEGGDHRKLKEEFGDVLFAVLNIARFYDVHPEEALLAANEKFTGRFRYIEQKVYGQSKDFKDFTLEQLDAWWDEAKELEKEEDK